MSKEDLLKRISEAVYTGDEELTIELTEAAVQEKIPPLEIINDGLTRGIQAVGNSFAEGTYYLPDLLIGAKAMEEGITILEPLLMGVNRDYLGKVVMGTVAGDIHEIGKNIVSMMLKTSGFEVIDIGIDVPSHVFVDKAREIKPDIIGISALLTTTVARQKEIIEILIEEGIRKDVKVIIGGAPINQEWADEIGADGYAEDANEAVVVAKKLLGIKK